MILSHEHKELYRQVRSFVDKELNPNILEWEKAGIVPREQIEGNAQFRPEMVGVDLEKDRERFAISSGGVVAVGKGVWI